MDSGEFRGGFSPLFFRVSVDKCPVQFLADQRNRLFLQVRRFIYSGFPNLLVQKGFRLFRREVASEEIAERLQVHRHEIDASPGADGDMMPVRRKLRETKQIAIDFLVGRVEDMGAVGVTFDPGRRIDVGSGVPADGRPFVYYEDAMPRGGEAFRHDGTEDAAPGHDDPAVSH